MLWSHRAPWSLAQRAPHAARLPVWALFYPTGAGPYGCKESEKPHIAELKKANAGPKGRTLAHRRATSRRSR